jgi:hypothetical protein
LTRQAACVINATPVDGDAPFAAIDNAFTPFHNAYTPIRNAFTPIHQGDS